MTRRTFSLVSLSSLLIGLMAMTTFAAKAPVDTRTEHPLLNRSLQYSLSDEQPLPSSSRKETPKYTLGSAAPSASPGALVGNTWYDKQRNGSMRRMITWGTHGSPDTLLVHFHWMYLPGPAFHQRAYAYSAYNAASATFAGPTPIQSDDEYAGYVVTDVTNDNRAILGGHNNTAPTADWINQTHAYWDFAPAACFFPTNCRVPDSLGLGCEAMHYPGETGHIWPAMCWQEGVDTILHVFAQESNPAAGDPQSLAYFRAVSPESSPCSWTVRCVDTVYDISQDCDCTDDGKLALAWVANIMDPTYPCNGGDTCSSDEIKNPGFVLYNQQDNDLYYQISLDGGLTWQPRVNVTKNVDSVEGYRPYTDVSVLITSDNNAHVVWSARWWPVGGPYGYLRNRIFHYSEDLPYIRTVHSADWHQTTCNGGSWNLNACKQTVSECDGKLYVLFVQFNDIPNGVEDDCAAPTHPGFPCGAANGELYMTISDDWGLTWDPARNLTNSRTPGCDSAGGVGGPCESDVWPSMARFGTDAPGDFSGAEIVDPSGSYTGNFFLDVQYINDHSAGAMVSCEGFWHLADVRWFRLACVEPDIYIPPPPIWPWKIDYPAWTKHGVQLDTLVTIENGGNTTVNYSVTEEEDTGPSGWLSTSGFSGSIPSGLNNIDTGTVHINTGGIVNDPGTIVELVGRLIFTWDIPSPPYSLEIRCWVTDTLIEPVWDTVWTACLGLTVTNTGNFGNLGMGGVNMDYVEIGGDCDPEADVYLYDGSPVVGYIKDGDTIANFSIFGTSYVDENGFVPLGGHTPSTDSADCEIFRSGKFVTHDSLIAVEKVWYAPKDPDTCGFVIECIRVYVNRDTTVTGVRIGEAIDWDIPSDTDFVNSSGFDAARKVIYQQGVETMPGGCQDNDRRWGGINFLWSHHNDSPHRTVQHGAYTADNAIYVFPQSGFVPQELYARMDTSGYLLYNSAHPDSQWVDLHTIMTFDTGLTLTPADTFVYWVELVTIMNGTLADFLEEVDQSRQWFGRHFIPDTCCCNHDGIRGDDNGDGQINIADLTYKVDYLFRGGPLPPCPEEMDVNGDGQINVADLTYEVDWMFGGGPPPLPCPPCP